MKLVQSPGLSVFGLYLRFFFLIEWKKKNTKSSCKLCNVIRFCCCCCSFCYCCVLIFVALLGLIVSLVAPMCQCMYTWCCYSWCCTSCSVSMIAFNYTIDKFAVCCCSQIMSHCNLTIQAPTVTSMFIWYDNTSFKHFLAIFSLSSPQYALFLLLSQSLWCVRLLLFCLVFVSSFLFDLNSKYTIKYFVNEITCK